MQIKLISLPALALLCAFNSQFSTAHAQGTAFSYQGQINSGGAPANGSYDLTFMLFSAGSGAGQVGGTLTNIATAVSNGLFTVTLDFGNQFPGASRWLEIGVRTNGGGSFATLSPRQLFTAAPYAITAGNLTGSLSAAQLSGTIAGGNLPASPSFSGTVTANSISGNGANVTNVNAATLNGLTAANFWQTNGNAGANPTNGAFIGTTDNLPLEFKVSGQRVLRIEPKTKPPGSTPAAPNVILGYFGNGVSNNPFAATILGGGVSGEPNIVSGSYGTVVGGSANTAAQNALAMGHNATASGAYSVAIGDQALASASESFAMGNLVAATNSNAVAFGIGTTAGGAGSTAMGDHSRASGQDSTAMGQNTVASGTVATAFGSGTIASNNFSTAMGNLTLAGGVASTAMGNRAQAIHDGTFVWSDYSTTTAFTSTSTNQFLVLATGGVGINTNNPGNAALNVNGTVMATSFIGDGSGLTGLPSGGSNGPVSLAQLPSAVVTNGAVGVALSGTFSGNGGGLTNLLAANLAGAVPDARLSTNVALLNGVNSFSGANAFFNAVTASGGVRLNDTNLWLRNDNNHGLGWYGNKTFAGTNLDGPVLFGFSGGGLGTERNGAENLALTWDSSGHVGIGNPSPAFPLDMLSPWAQARFVTANSTVGSVILLNNLSPAVSTYGAISFQDGLGQINYRTNNIMTFFTAATERMRIAGGGGIYVNENPIYLRANDTGHGLAYSSSVSDMPIDGPFLWGFSGGALGTSFPDTVALKWDAEANVWISNNCSVATLTIRGGADLAEPFKITSDGGYIPQGSVVVIDDEHPGHLKLSDRPYDTRVAGVVSGANGINPGIQMQQQGLIDGGKNVALTGRVYVQAEASNGAIKPGDMLTTSSAAGYAMKVADHARAQGAILGKAMTGLSTGKGMVLVLVTLQ